MDKFIEREIWGNLISQINQKQITILLGPRQVGKTTLILHLIEYLKKNGQSVKNIFYYNLDDIDLRTQIKRDFRFLQKDLELKTGQSLDQLKEKLYLFIDEGQKAPALFDLLKIFYDQDLLIKIFVSGSSSLRIRDQTAETLSGRASYQYLSSLRFSEAVGSKDSLYEHLEKMPAEGDLKKLASFGFRNKNEFDRVLRKMLFLGGLPQVFTANQEEGLLSLNNFLTTYLDKDIKDIGAKVNLETFHLSFKFLAEYTANLFNFSKIAQDVGAKRESLYRYFELLEKTLVLQTISPFTFPELKNIFKSKKLFFFDAGVVNRLRGFINWEELEKSDFLGCAFENFIFQNFFSRVLNDIKRPSIYYFRDYQNHEIDLIYQRGEKIIPIEISYSNAITKTKLRNFLKFFSLCPRVESGLIFYLGEVQSFSLAQRKVFALPYFLV